MWTNTKYAMNAYGKTIRYSLMTPILLAEQTRCA